jgi:hypothetical protein
MKINRMPMYRKLIIILFAVSQPVCSISQSPECFFVHFDKSFYVSGETLWFKAYKIDRSNEVQSRVLHVDLVDHKNQLVARQKLLLQNGATHGNISLPIDAEEGYYRFRAFTRHDLNFEPPVVYRATLPVYQLNKEKLTDSLISVEGSTALSSVDGISVTTNREIYQPRDSLEISFKIEGAVAAGKSYSISVVPVELAIPNLDRYESLECPEFSLKQGTLKLPEQSLFVHGRLQDPITGKQVNSRLLSVYVDKTSQLIRASAQNGRIRVSVPDYWGAGIFQIINLDPYNPSVLELVQDSALEAEDPYINPTPPQRTPRVLNYLNQTRKRRKIIELFDLYQSAEIKTIAAEPKVPDAIYRAENFKQIYSFEQFINEAIPNVKVRLVDSTKTVRLFYKEQGRLFEDHPWYLVDGFLTFNEEEVLQIPFQDIEEVRLYFRAETLEQYFHGFMLRSGVMEVITREVKYVRELKNSPNVVEIEGFAEPMEFGQIFIKPQSDNTPDLRSIMYWAPNVTADESGNGHIRIPLSDDTGKYAVVMMGTNGLQQLVTGNSSFEIKQKNDPQ